MQWQELATALVGRAMKRSYAPAQLIEQFPKAFAMRPEIVDQMTAKVLQSYSDVDNPYIVKAILWTLVPAYAPFAINWLSGRELSEAQAKTMDLPNTVKDDKDAESFKAACQILNLIGDYTTPVICFDELDGTESADEDSMNGGYTRAQVVASLAKDIYNNLERGVLITAMYRRTWNDEFSHTTAATAIKDRIAHHEIELSTTLKPDDVVSLVSYWLNHFYTKHELIPPHALYPFDENQLREIGQDEPTIRDVLRWCAKNFNGGIDPLKKIESLYQKLEASLEDYLDDNNKIANAIAFGLDYLTGQTLEGVTLKGLDREVKPKGKHYGFINFKILGEENGKDVKIGVAVVQNSNGNSVRAAIKYLTQYDTFDLTRGCLVRSKTIPQHWQVAQTHLDELQNQLGGERVSFKDDEIKPLLTLHQLSKSVDQDSFSREDFHRFVEDNGLIMKNTLLSEILSKPLGKVPEELIDEDDELEKLLSSELSNSSEIDESEDLDFLSVA